MNHLNVLRFLSDIDPDIIISAYLTKKRVVNLKRICIAAIAACLLLIISTIIPITARYYQRLDTSSILSSTNEHKKTLDILSHKKFFGDIKLTKKPFDEVIQILSTVKTDGDIKKVYEDNEYLYHFHSDGEIVELAQKHSKQKETTADFETIKNKINDIFVNYLTKENQQEYDIKIIENKDSYPTWTVTAKKYENNICISNIYIAFTNSGELKTLVISDNYNNGLKNEYSINKDKAVEIAINEAKKEEYGLSFSKNNSEEISIETKKTEIGKIYYRVTIRNLQFKNIPDAITAFGVDIDVNTGEVIKHYQYK